MCLLPAGSPALQLSHSTLFAAWSTGANPKTTPSPYKSAQKLPGTGMRDELLERYQTARLDDATGRTPRFCLRIIRLRLAVAFVYHSRSHRSFFRLCIYLAFFARNSPNLSASTASTSDTGDVPASCKLLVRLVLSAYGIHVTCSPTRTAVETHVRLLKLTVNYSNGTRIAWKGCDAIDLCCTMYARDIRVLLCLSKVDYTSYELTYQVDCEIGVWKICV